MENCKQFNKPTIFPILVLFVAWERQQWPLDVSVGRGVAAQTMWEQYYNWKIKMVRNVMGDGRKGTRNKLTIFHFFVCQGRQVVVSWCSMGSGLMVQAICQHHFHQKIKMVGKLTERGWKAKTAQTHHCPLFPPIFSQSDASNGLLMRLGAEEW